MSMYARLMARVSATAERQRFVPGVSDAGHDLVARLFRPYSARDLRQRQLRWGRQCPVVEPETFVRLDEARSMLGLRTRTGVRSLLTRRVLDPCVCGDLDLAESYGATRLSVAREAERRRTATFADRVDWRIRAVLHWF